MTAPTPRPAPTPADWARLYDALLALAVGEARYAAAARGAAFVESAALPERIVR